MALPSVTFTTLDGGLGRTLSGDDSISALVLENSNQPNGVAKTVVVYSLQEAVNLGIISTGATAEAHYHITQFFADPAFAAPLYITFSEGDYNADFNELQNLANSTISQVGIVDSAPFVTATLSAIQSAVNAQKEDYRGFSVLYSTTNFSGLSLATLPDLTTLNAPNVSVVISQDADSAYSCVGASLRTLAKSKVSQSVAEVAEFNVVMGTEFDVLKFSTGELYNSVTKAQMTQLNNRHYIFLKKYSRRSGSYHQDSHTATNAISDFAEIENNRSLEKAKRNLYNALVDKLNSRLKTTDGGRMTQTTIANFELICQNTLEALVNANELSKFRIFIDPAQNVQSSSALNIQVGLTPLGIARFIDVTIGFEL